MLAAASPFQPLRRTQGRARSHIRTADRVRSKCWPSVKSGVQNDESPNWAQCVRQVLDLYSAMPGSAHSCVRSPLQMTVAPSMVAPQRSLAVSAFQVNPDVAIVPVFALRAPNWYSGVQPPLLPDPGPQLPSM